MKREKSRYTMFVKCQNGNTYHNGIYDTKVDYRKQARKLDESFNGQLGTGIVWESWVVYFNGEIVDSAVR